MARSWLFCLALPVFLFAQAPDTAFFEAKIRPILTTKCYGCHNSSSKAPMGGLAVDSKSALLKGGASGPVLIPGKPDESRMLQALKYTDPQLQMPPTGKLPDSVIADFQTWIAGGRARPAHRRSHGCRSHRCPKGHVGGGRPQVVGVSARSASSPRRA